MSPALYYISERGLAARISLSSVSFFSLARASSLIQFVIDLLPVISVSIGVTGFSHIILIFCQEIIITLRRAAAVIEGPLARSLNMQKLENACAISAVI
jgi:hypothetical protein